MHERGPRFLSDELGRRAFIRGGLSLLAAMAATARPGYLAAASLPMLPNEQVFPSPAEATASPKRIALTFDDGNHSRSIPRLLDILDRENVTATFFPIGYWVRDYPALFERVALRHEVGNHTLNHVILTKLTDENMRGEILGGVKSSLLRPPHGATNARVRAMADSLGMRIVLWDVDSRDWTGVSAAQIATNVVNGADDGRIVLMHMGYQNTVDALPDIISRLRARGYQFVTISQLAGSPVASNVSRSVSGSRRRIRLI